MRVIGIPVALLLTISCAGMWPASAWSGESGETFCQGKTLRAYEAPLEGLPAVRESPSNSKPGWASTRLSLRRENDGLVVAGESISYRLTMGGAKYGELQLNWRVESDLVRIDRRGRSLGVAKRRIDWIGRIAPGDERYLGFRRSSRPGLYRYDISFFKDGERLSRYRDYYRVVSRSTDVRLALNGTTFQPGEQILGKVENFSTEWLFYGLGFRVERYDGAAWLPVDLSALFGQPFGFLLIGLGIGPGLSDDCSSTLPVPTTMSPGLYRMVKSVDVLSRRSFRESPQSIAAEFTIVTAIQ